MANELVAGKATLDPYCSVMTKTVMGLLQKTKLLDNHRTVFFDNYFNSCELLEEMYRDTYSVGNFYQGTPPPPHSQYLYIIIFFLKAPVSQ